jgi:membrane associated rhomboid family serine protease
VSVRGRFASLRITPGAFFIIAIEIGFSLVWLMSKPDGRATIEEYFVATAPNVFEHGRVWTLVTTNFLELNFITLLLHGMMMWMFVPTLERFWGTARFYRFFAVTSILGSAAGAAMGLATGREFPIAGIDPFIYASVVAFGIVYARQPVSFFGVLPLTGRQFMWGFVVFLSAYVLLQQFWELGAALFVSMVTAALMCSKRFSPGLTWKRWRLARARAKLSVIDGGKKPKTKEEQKWLN